MKWFTVGTRQCFQGRRSNSKARGQKFGEGHWPDYDVIMTSYCKGSGGFKDCGTWDRKYLWGKRRVFFKLFSVEVVMHHGCALRFPL